MTARKDKDQQVSQEHVWKHKEDIEQNWLTPIQQIQHVETSSKHKRVKNIQKQRLKGITNIRLNQQNANLQRV